MLTVRIVWSEALLWVDLLINKRVWGRAEAGYYQCNDVPPAGRCEEITSIVIIIVLANTHHTSDLMLPILYHRIETTEWGELGKYCDTDIRILDLSQMIEQKMLPPALQSASDPILWDYNHGRPVHGISFYLF